MTSVCVTGGSGFIGSHLIRHLLMETTWDIEAIVSYENRGSLERVESAVQGFSSSRYQVIPADLSKGLSEAHRAILEVSV